MKYLYRFMCLLLMFVGGFCISQQLALGAVNHAASMPTSTYAVSADYMPGQMVAQLQPQMQKAACSWTGTWKTNWGMMRLSQNSGYIAGNYDHDAGKINGVVHGNKLEGEWSESPSYTPPNDAGQIVFIMSDDCKSFKGSWRYGDQRHNRDWSMDSWSGTRESGSIPAPSGTGSGTPPPIVSQPPITPPSSGSCSWTGTWKTNWGMMRLSQNSGYIAGNYDHDAGKINGVVHGNKLEGEWSESPSYTPPNDAGQIVFTMSDDCKSFKGSWRYGDQRHNRDWSMDSWSGTRESGSIPAPSGTGTTTSTGGGNTGTGGGSVYPPITPSSSVLPSSSSTTSGGTGICQCPCICPTKKL